MNVPVICTIVAKNYLAQARSLVASFLEHHPDGRAFVLLVDRPDAYYDPDKEPFTTILAEDIGIPNFWMMTFRYTILELNTAVKPFFLEYLFKNYDYDKICYFDPDIYFYQPVDEIWEKLNTYHIVLTPHLLGPLDDEFRPNEISILQSGTYNLGFIGLSRHPEVDEFLTWWQGKLAKYCVVDIEKGLFVDQKWIDLVPGRFSGVYIDQDPGCNAAYWNLYHREVTRSRTGGYLVNGMPLKFFHFSGYSPDHPDVISKHQNRYAFRDLPHLRPLFDAYRTRLLENGYDTVKHWPYSYDSKSRTGVRIPDVARTLWRDFEFNDPFWHPFEMASDDQFIDNLLTWLNEPVGNASTRPVITRLALAVYQQLPSVQHAFPDVMGHDRVEYVRWFINWGRYESKIDDFFVDPIEVSIKQYFKSRKRLQGLGARFYQSFTNWLFHIGVGRQLERMLGASFVGKIRNFFIKSDPSKPIVTPPLPALGTPPVSEAALGVNIVGYLCDETGVGESARATMRALGSQDFPLAWTMVKSSGARQEDKSALDFPPGHPYNINLFYVNADQTPVVYEELGASFFAGKYNIGYWAWELERFPRDWMDRFKYLDEIWVGSRFVQNTLAHVAPIPVVIMGVGMDASVSADVSDRDVLGIARDKFVFLFSFDMLSFIERKNPYGVIEAYRRAFGSASQDTLLVIKVNNLERSSEHQAALRQAVDSVSGMLIDHYLSRTELDLLFNRCDAYVSLHRSEGFGMTIAEAMCLGKPVIATDYSGNTDYMNVSNSYPVSYRLAALDQDYGPYRCGELWADPDLDHAAAQMRHVFENQSEARLRGERAAADIRRWYGHEAMGKKIVERLEFISSFQRGN